MNVSPAQVPATGKQESIVTLDAPAMVRISAKSSAGTACTVVDKVRGPFTNAGQVGRKSCELDLLLDIGSYKLRLESPKRGKGKVDVSAKAFTEVNVKPVKLEANKGPLEQTLKPGEQASFWLSLEKPEIPNLRIFGRTAGLVTMWRNGEWLEQVSLQQTLATPEPGRAIHEWTLGSKLEAGDYLVTVYGTAERPWAGSGVSDAISIELGHRPGPSERALSFLLPASGFAAWSVPNVPTAALLSLDAAPAATTSLQLADLGTDNALSYGYTSSCSIDPKQLVPQCSGYATSKNRHVVVIRGAPGTKGTLEWTNWADPNATWRGGWYGGPLTQVLFDGWAGDGLIGLHDLPADGDAAPLGCQLERLDLQGNAEVVARDMPAINDGEELDVQFNYGGGSESVWFEVKKSERYRIQTKGDRKNTCEVYRMESDGKLKRLSESKEGVKGCNESLNLSSGTYQVTLYNGLSGIERLVVREDNQRALKPAAPKAGCAFTTPMATGRFRLNANRAGRITARGLVAEPLPLMLAGPVHVLVDAKKSLRLPVARGIQATVTTAAGAAITSTQTADVLTLTNPGDAVVSVTIARRPPPTPLPTPAFTAWAPNPKPLPRVPINEPIFFDFDRNESHSMVFDVDTAGLYNITTVGLLSTTCRMRTPVVPAVTEDRGSGRGRNCLVSGYLRPGKYMVTVATTGNSRGRGGVVMTRRNPKEFQSVATDAEAYFRVEAGELVQQKLVVTKEASYQLGTTGQGVSLMCRFDDAQGWPIETVPSSCVGNRYLTTGTYLWTQLPLTVESMRRTKLERVKDAVVLKGNKPHAVDYFTWYSAHLGPDGKDEFTFKLEGEVTLDVVLTGGMQGRVFLMETDKPPRAVEVIPPQQVAEPANEYSEESPPEENYEGSYEGGEGEGEGSEGSEEGGEEYQPPSRRQQNSAPVVARQTVTTPAGVKLTLPPGNYKIVTEHSRGNVGVDYQLHLGSDILLPGMTRDLPTPTSLTVKVPRDGTLRLRTEGEADVRCRLFDERGELMFEGSDNGADWNCALAEPVKKGSYTLVLESETQQVGQSKLSVALAAVEDKGLVADAQTLKLAAAVQTFAIPAAEKDGLAEISFKSRTPISCALEDGKGEVVARKIRVGECALLVRPQTDKFRVRLWTTDGTAAVTTGYKAKAATTVIVPKAGRYKTTGASFCLPATLKGLLKPCGPETSLEAGPTVFDATPALAEVPLKVDKPDSMPLPLSKAPYLQQLTAGAGSIFLLTGTVQHGERTAPSCAFDGAGTVREGRDSSCFAASGVTASAIARAWSPTAPENPVSAKLAYRALKLPAKADPLVPGRRRLNWLDETGAFAVPSNQRARLELTLPTDAWAILLDDKGNAIDFCAPSGSVLARCVLTGKGGKLVLTSAEPAVDVTTVLLDAPEKNQTLSGLYEESPRLPGTMRLKVPAAEGERTVVVEGNVERCTVALADGVRTAGCRATVPTGTAAEVVIEHKPGAMRATVFPTGKDRHARLGVQLAGAPGPALPPAVAVAVASGQMDRMLTVEKDAIVRVTAESGVCALFKGNDLLAVDGLDAGCELVRLLSPGQYRLVVRPFAGQLGPGLLRWTAEPVLALGEGVGAEDWISPAEVRVYKFNTGSTGRVGLGIQARAESLDCAVYNDGYKLLGEGCQQFLALDKGSYLLTVRQPPKSGNAPLRFKPVLLGLAGAKAEVPEEYLKDLFNRIGVSK